MREVRARGAGDRRQPTPSAGESNDTDILPPLGCCINCRIRIDVTAGTLRCPTCAAWRRWYSAHRIASQALREVSQ